MSCSDKNTYGTFLTVQPAATDCQLKGDRAVHERGDEGVRRVKDHIGVREDTSETKLPEFGAAAALAVLYSQNRPLLIIYLCLHIYISLIV